MSLLEALTGFLAGLILIFLAATVFRLRLKTEARLVLNSLLGIAALFALNYFRVIAIPFNLFNALVIGFLGLPGVVLLYVVLIL